ncbi:sugar transferase [Candidatus Peregrinibacteria bacterium]|nr:MAG: sugar transferase [Candidatus Peregrinibacteria bacterium]
MKRFDMYFVLARIPLSFFSGFAGWWLARIVRPITDLIPGLHSWFDPRFIPDASFFLPFSLYASCGFVLSIAFLGGFGFREEDWTKEAPRILLSVIVWGMGIVSFFVMVAREVIFSRMILIQALFFTTILYGVFLILLRAIKYSLWADNVGISRVMLVGEEENRRMFQRILKNAPGFCYRKEFGPKDDIDLNHVDEVWHVDPFLSEETGERLRSLCYREHRVFRFIPWSSVAFARMELHIFSGVPLLRPVPESLSGWGRVMKRLFDVCASVVFALLLSPLFLLLGIGVKLTSQGTIFYGATRIGRDGKPFRCFKFRSMVQNADAFRAELEKENHRRDGPFFKIRNDPRVTAFGRFLRRFSLDELPQLWNVFLGEMSLVGPRPHLPEEIEKFTPELRRVLSVRPGLVGLSQVSGRSDLRFDEEMRLDIYYLENWSFWLDVKIVLKATLVVLRGRGAD